MTAAVKQGRKPRRVWLKIVIGVVAIVLALAGWVVIERYRAKAALAKYERELRSRGEKLSTAELIPPAIEGENKAAEVVRLCGSLQTGNVLPLNSPPIMRLIAPGKAIVISQEPDWAYGSNRRYTWAETAPDLQTNAESLHNLRLALKGPVLRMELDYQTGPFIKLPHLASGKSGATWLGTSAAYHLHTGNHEGAIEDVEALVALGRLYEDEPIMLSQLVRLALAAMGFDRTWLALQHPGWTDAQLLRLQALWQRGDYVTPMISALEMERSFSRRALDRLRNGVEETNQASALQWFFFDEGPDTNKVSESLRSLPFGDEMADFLQEKIPAAFQSAVVIPMWRFAWSYRDEQHLLEILQAIIDTTRTAQKQKSASVSREPLKQLAARAGSPGAIERWKFVYSRWLAGGFGKATSRAFRAETHRQLTLTAIALHRYHLRHKQFPERLSDLVPEFLGEHPVDYMDGQKLRYRAEKGAFVLWSVGDDGKDDGGTADQTEPYNFFNGPDLVLPQPASEAEIEAYNEKMQPRRR